MIEEIDVLDHPQGFPYVLYQQGQRFILAATETQAHRRLGAIGPLPTPADVNFLTGVIGHSMTHRLFKKHGDSWIVKNGRIFYRKMRR